MSILSKVPLKELQKFSDRLLPGTAANGELIWEIERRKKRCVIRANPPCQNG